MDLPMKRPISGDQRSHYRIEARNLCYKISESFDGLNWVCGGGSSKRGPKFILKNVNCEARAGEITAIAGPSGAGKTTLLEILGGNIPLKKISGQVLVNHQFMLEKMFPRISGYVTQDDALFPFLTVEETLMYSALLRLAGGRNEAEARVRKLMKDLGLEHVAASRVGGGSNRGISGGERRRVSIGVELVHDPAVIFIDEPTSGLDSVSALHVISVLRRMVISQGKTVLLTIHQPGFRILELFDRLILLSSGVVMHNGSLDHLEERLKLANHQIPHHVNVLEFAIDVVDSLAMHTSETFNRLHYLQNKVENQTIKVPCLDKDEEPISYQNSRSKESARLREGVFRTPCDEQLLAALPPESHNARVAFLMPKSVPTHKMSCVVHLAGTGDHTFERRLRLGGPLLKDNIATMVLESPFYGQRRPMMQYGAKLLCVSDLLLLGRATIEEARSLLHWLDSEAGFGKMGVCGLSMGGVHAAMVGSLHPTPIATLPFLSPHSAVVAFCEGILKHGTAWEALRKDLALQKSAMTLEDVKERMRNVLSLTDVTRFPIPKNPNAVILVAATDDGYIPKHSVLELQKAWPGSEVRWVTGGHVSSFILHNDEFRRAIVDGLDRLEWRESSL